MQDTTVTIPEDLQKQLKILLEDKELRKAAGDFFTMGGEYRHILNMTGEQIESIYALALEFYKADKYDKAGPLCQLICFIDGKQRKYWRALGAVRQMQDETEAAVSAYSMALMLEPENPSVLIDMGNTLLTAGALTRARDAFQGVLDISPDDPAYESLRETARKRMELIDALQESAATA